MIDTCSYGNDLLVVRLRSEYTTLPKEYQRATGQDFWEDLRKTVLPCCPELSKRHPSLNIDRNLCFTLGRQSAASLGKYALKVKEAVEQRAVHVWLRPGVPSLFALVTEELTTQGKLVASLMEFQRKYGYHASKQIIAQHSQCLKLEP